MAIRLVYTYGHYKRYEWSNGDNCFTTLHYSLQSAGIVQTACLQIRDNAFENIGRHLDPILARYRRLEYE